MKLNSLPAVPVLAGIATYQEAMRPGLSVDECVKRLKRYHYAWKRLQEIFIHRLTSEPLYELKMGFSLHAHLCAEHATVLRKRVSEMREPPLGLDAVPHPALAVFFDEILSAPTTGALLAGVYCHALPALRRGLERHLAETNPLVDHPSVRLCRFALLELETMLEFGGQASSAMPIDAGAEADGWLALMGITWWRQEISDGAGRSDDRSRAVTPLAKPHSYTGGAACR